MLSLQLHLREIRFVLAGLVEVDNGLITSVVSSVFGYLALLIEFHLSQAHATFDADQTDTRLRSF